MPVIDISKDVLSRTMVVTASFQAPVARIWQLWADPRQLEQWWGPPTYPATVVDHDLTPGGSVTYVMTGPDGDEHKGWWKVLSVDEPNEIQIEDGFSDESGTPNPDMPSTLMSVSITDLDGATRMTITSTFPSQEAMEQMAEMGLEEGIRSAVNQIDSLLTVQA